MVDAGSPECGVNVLVKNIRSTRNPKVSLTNKVTVIVKSAAGEDTIVIDQGRALSVRFSYNRFPISQIVMQWNLCVCSREFDLKINTLKIIRCQSYW